MPWLLRSASIALHIRHRSLPKAPYSFSTWTAMMGPPCESMYGCTTAPSRANQRLVAARNLRIATAHLHRRIPSTAMQGKPPNSHSAHTYGTRTQDDKKALPAFASLQVLCEVILITEVVHLPGAVSCTFQKT